jgi:UDP-N-acetylglucosamine 2-epimerase (non-hydrolysing)
MHLNYLFCERVTLRDNTERPETIEVGSNVVSGTEPQSISEKSRMMLENVPNWENPFGDGNAASKIIHII